MWSICKILTVLKLSKFQVWSITYLCLRKVGNLNPFWLHLSSSMPTKCPKIEYISKHWQYRFSIKKSCAKIIASKRVFLSNEMFDPLGYPFVSYNTNLKCQGIKFISNEWEYNFPEKFFHLYQIIAPGKPFMSNEQFLLPFWPLFVHCRPPQKV